MRRSVVLLLSAALLAVGAFTACYFTAARARHAAGKFGDELDWLRGEFHLSDAEMARVRALHAGYLPQCEAMCERIAAKNRELSAALTGSTNVSADVRARLAETAALRAECQAQMLAHFYEVSKAMPPAAGRRYLEQMKSLTLGLHAQQEAAMTHSNPAPHVRP